jgi:hypothetical protein
VRAGRQLHKSSPDPNGRDCPARRAVAVIRRTIGPNNPELPAESVIFNLTEGWPLKGLRACRIIRDYGDFVVAVASSSNAHRGLRREDCNLAFYSAISAL